MTKINKLSMHGFKSFARKTEISFGDNYNCILGPNGSGKSNIGDALCFVLGRLSAKSMRAEKAANLIFNGGKNKQPMAHGTVEIEFDNKTQVFPSKKDAVTISRTITKKGSSIYRVDDKKTTRTQVLDYLSHANINSDAYNIILQGDITRFVDMSALERRRVIEQISDISHYEEKKRKATLELAKAEEKINNATIVLKERKAHLRELKKDRDQAIQYKEVKDKVSSYRASYLKIKIDAREEEKAKYDSTISKHEQKIKEMEIKVTAIKQDIEAGKQEIKKINEEIESKGEKGQVDLHKEIEIIKTELIQNRTRVQTLLEQIQRVKQRKSQFKDESKELLQKDKDYQKKVSELKKQVLQKQKESELIQAKIKQFKKKHNMDDSKSIEEEISNKDKLIDEKTEAVQKIRAEQQELLREKDRLEFRIQSIDEQILKVKGLQKEHKEQILDLKNKKVNFKQAALKLSKALDLDSSYVSQISHARKKLIQIQEEHAKLDAKARSIQASMQGNAAVSAILENKRKFKGVYGTISELGQVNKKYAAPLELLAGSRTKQIVVDTDLTAAKCIDYLKSEKLGRASFIPLNKIRYSQISIDDKKALKMAGVHDFALNLITFKPEFKKAFAYVFGKSLVVEDLSSARKVGIGKVRMATLDGSIVESSGVMSGGFRNRRAASSFKQRDSLERLEKLESEIANEQAVISKIENQRGANDEQIQELRKIKAELEGEIIKLEKALHLDTNDLDASSTLKKELNVELKNIDDKISAIQRQISAENKGLARLKGEKQILRSKILQSNDPKVVAQISAFHDAVQRCRDTVLTGNNDIKNLEKQREQLIGPEIEKISEIVKQQDKELEQFDLEIKEKTISVKEQEKVLKEKELASKEFYNKYKKMFNQREELNSKVSANETKLENMRDKSRGEEREINLHALKNAEIKAKLSVLREEYAKFEQEIKDKKIELITDHSEKELYAQISKFEAILNQMSAVNMKALEIYERVEEEFNKLLVKKDSLINEKTDILTLMNEIELHKKEKFESTFDVVNKHFKHIFTKLFRKGDAYLKLDNPKDPFSDGVSIKVKITGKRHMDLKSLSGGEKTLTALSFIFAVQEHNPATFYILDEIDAALDKHNAERLAKLISSYSGNAQYIVISHNDSVISGADNLYGVSMQEGISKVTGLKL